MSWRGCCFAFEVSNFDAPELQRLLAIARVKPHLLQGNLWSVVFDPALINLCADHGILFQAYNVMNGAASGEAQRGAPRAAALLRRVGRDLGRQGRPGASHNLDAAEVVVKWLTQRGMGVVPRASNPVHLMANAPRTVQGAPNLSSDEADDVALAVRCLLGGSDRELGPQTPEELAFADQEAADGGEASGEATRDQPDEAGAVLPVTATFRNALHLRRKHDAAAALAVSVFWLREDTNEEVHAAGPLGSGEEVSVSTWPGHRFVVRAHSDTGTGVTSSTGRHFAVTAPAGQEQHFHIDEL